MNRLATETGSASAATPFADPVGLKGPLPRPLILRAAASSIPRKASTKSPMWRSRTAWSPASAGGSRRPGAEVLDSPGMIVSPGFIDLHTHVYWGGTSLGVDATALARRSGVTTFVDAGSAGPGNYRGFLKHVIEPSEVRILAYLHVSFAGIYAFSHRIMVGESPTCG